MQLLFRLPFLLLESLVRQGLSALTMLTRLLRSGDDEPVAPAPSAAPPSARSVTADDDEAAAPGPPPPTAEEAIERRFERESAARATAEPVVELPRRPARSGPNGGSAAHVDREATVVESVGPAEDVHATLTVDAPWEGYDRMPAGAIVDRLRTADDATRAMVRLYEQTHKNRPTVVRATA